MGQYFKALAKQAGVPDDEIDHHEKAGLLPKVGDFLLGNSMRVAQDIGTGIRGMETKGTLNNLDTLASQMEADSQTSTNPEEQKALLQSANRVRASQGGEAQDIANSFSSDVNQNPAWRGLKSGLEVASTAQIPSTIMSAVKGVGNLMKGPAVEQIADKSIPSVVSKLPPISKPIIPGETIEQYIERVGGWKVPGLRRQFDLAMQTKDAASIEKLLPNVPAEYQQRFATEIGNILGNSVEK